jgi:hypothetical protein
MLRPRLKMPMWAAAAVVAVAYVARSGLRGWDFRPDLPIDAVLATTLVALIVLRGTLARSAPAGQPDEQRPSEVPDDDCPADDPGCNEKVGAGLDP